LAAVGYIPRTMGGFSKSSCGVRAGDRRWNAFSTPFSNEHLGGACAWDPLPGRGRQVFTGDITTITDRGKRAEVHRVCSAENGSGGLPGGERSLGGKLAVCGGAVPSLVG